MAMASHRNPSFVKARAALRFLRIVHSLRRRTALLPVSRRYRAVRAAAYASMAHAAGPRRAWSRALLGKLRRASASPGRNPSTSLLGFESEEHLRDLVPGGAHMDSASLLDEAGHYIVCLKAQIEIMKRILGCS